MPRAVSRADLFVKLRKHRFEFDKYINLTKLIVLVIERVIIIVISLQNEHLIGKKL